MLLGPDGIEVGRYDKIDLVPFGEFVPRVFWFVNRITQGGWAISCRGTTSRFCPLWDTGSAFSFATNPPFRISCGSSAEDGADILVNLSNDAYFGHSEAREQHLLLARMRAVENRRYLIRSTNDGITAVINPAGEIVQRLPMYQEVAAPMRYGVIESTTFYSRHGDWFAWSCLAVGVGLALFRLLRPSVAQSADLDQHRSILMVDGNQRYRAAAWIQHASLTRGL